MNRALLFLAVLTCAMAQWNGNVVDLVTGTGISSMELIVVAGRPAICYIASNTVFFMRASDNTGMVWPQAANQVSTGGTSLVNVDCAAFGTNPMVAWRQDGVVQHRIATKQ